MTSWRERRAARRIRPGDGRPLPRFRWWQLLSRALFTIELPGPASAPDAYAVDVRQWGDRDDGEVRARLYRNGAQHEVSRLPARFVVPGGAIEVAMGGFALRRCHFVAADGTERLLEPHPRSAEGRRARSDRRHPTASRVVGVIATAAVLVGAVVALSQLIEPIAAIPPIRERFGVIGSPLQLPLEANVAIGVAVLLGSLERALRLRSNWLDSLAN